MSYKFFFGEALRGLRRNLSITIAMIITSSIALVMLGVGLLIANMAENSKEQWVDRTEISIFIEPKVAVKDKDCSKKGCGDLREALLESDSVKSVRYRNQQQSLDVGRLTARADTAEIFEQADAKAMPGTLLVKLKGENTDPAPIEAIVAKFPKVAQPAVHGKDGRPSVYISDSRQLINRLFSFLDLTRNAAYGLAAFLGVGALLLIANMVMAAFTRRKTTQVMRLLAQAVYWCSVHPGSHDQFANWRCPRDCWTLCGTCVDAVAVAEERVGGALDSRNHHDRCVVGVADPRHRCFGGVGLSLHRHIAALRPPLVHWSP